MKPPTSFLALSFVKAERAIDSIQVNEIDISDLTSMPDVMIILVRPPIGAYARVWIKTDDKDEWVAANEADLRKKMLLMIEFQEALIKKEFQDAIVRTNSCKLELVRMLSNQANADKAAADKEEVY